jgi:adenylate cyclase
MTFLAALRQRKLVQWSVAYVAAAFALLQGIDIVAQRFGWPDVVERALIIAIFVGFFVTLLLAWYHGERGAQKASGTELLLLALLLTIGGGLLWKFSVSSGVRSHAAGTAVPGLVGDRRSIAVLPFVNMSGDKDNEYFSDGISEEILNVLARTPDLHVAARTSSFSFKDKAMEVPAIARQLEVRMVLEGSVRKQGDRVRITAQLIDAKTGFHVWSQTYDRRLQDIFAIQDEIAKAIGDELEVKLADARAPGRNSAGTKNLKAYDLYLRGIALWNTREAANLLQALALFDQSAKADPRYAEAYAGQALVYTVLPYFTDAIAREECHSRASDLALRALALDPNLPEVYTVLANEALATYHRDTARALLERVIAARPSYATAHQWLGSLSMSDGDRVRGLAEMEKAVSLDPRAPVIGDNHAFILLTLGRYADARAGCEKVLLYAPEHSGCLQYIGLAWLMEGNIDAARPYLQKMAKLQDPSAQREVDDLLAALSGKGNGHALAVRMAALPYGSNVAANSGNVFEDQVVAVLLVMLHEPELAMDYMARIAAVPGASIDWAIRLPQMDPLRCQPRFRAIVASLRTTDPAATNCTGRQ